MSKGASSSRLTDAGAPLAREPGPSATPAGPAAPVADRRGAPAPVAAPVEGEAPPEAGTAASACSAVGAPAGFPLFGAGSTPAGGATPGSGATKLEKSAEAPPNTRIIRPVPSPKPGVGTGVVIRTAGATAPLSRWRAATSSTVSPARASAPVSAGSVVKGTAAPAAASPACVTATGTPSVRTPVTARSVFGGAGPSGARCTVTELWTEPMVSGPTTTDSTRLTALATAPAVANPTLPPPSLLMPPVATASALPGELVAFRW